MDAAERKRWGRQIRLAEVGEAGQARLRATTVVPSARGADARHFEARYLTGAGVVVTSSDEASGPSLARDHGPLLAALGVHHPASRDLAEGALLALAVVRSAILAEVSGPTS